MIILICPELYPVIDSDYLINSEINVFKPNAINHPQDHHS